MYRTTTRRVSSQRWWLNGWWSSSTSWHTCSGEMLITHLCAFGRTELWILQKADAYISKCCSSLSDEFFQFTSSQLKCSELFVGKTKLTFSNAVGDTMLLWPALSVHHDTLSVKIKFSRHDWELIDPWRETPVLSFSQRVQRSEWLQLLKSQCFAQGPYSRIDKCRQADLEPEHLS